MKYILIILLFIGGIMLSWLGLMNMKPFIENGVGWLGSAWLACGLVMIWAGIYILKGRKEPPSSDGA